MIISNSEVDTYLRCKKLHLYKNAMGLNPKAVSKPNSIGNLGHHVMEHFYRAIQVGGTIEDARTLGIEEITKGYDFEDADVVGIVMNTFLLYVKRFAQADTKLFRIESVEGKYTVPLNDRITFGLTLDLLVEYISGPWKGQYGVIDHKYKYNFDSPDELSMHVQTPKYVWALRQLGYPVRHSTLNQIRYRADIKDEEKLFKRQEIVPTGIHLENIMDEHLAVAEEIYTMKALPITSYSKLAHRRLYSKDCGGCYFRLPCRQELVGVDSSSVLVSMYTPDNEHGLYKTYGYGDMEDAVN